MLDIIIDHGSLNAFPKKFNMAAAFLNFVKKQCLKTGLKIDED